MNVVIQNEKSSRYGPPPALAKHQAFYKRAMDILGATSCFVFLSPLMAIIASLIVLEQRDWPIFRQDRIGKSGRVFKILKFRTMTPAPYDPSQVSQRMQATQLGRVLRRLSLDELPQLINVLGGTMSLVGPRPHAVDHDRQLELTTQGYAKRRAVRPGCPASAPMSQN